MKKLSFDQKLVVARVLNRYVGQSRLMNCNKALIAAMEKWISADASQGRNMASCPLKV